MQNVTSGNIIFLNGTSSSGKTTLAKTLQNFLDQPYFLVGIDEFQHGFPPGLVEFSDGLNPPAAPGWLIVFEQDGMVEVRIGPLGMQFLSGMYRAFAGLAAAGNNLIVDDVIYDSRVLREAVRILHPYPVLFVGVHLPLEVAEAREQARGDRAPGGARTFYPHVHAHKLYDVEVDTARATSEECAKTILAALQNPSPRTAFQQMAEQLG